MTKCHSLQESAKESKLKTREDEDDDEMTELELRRAALVSAKKGFESKKSLTDGEYSINEFSYLQMNSRYSLALKYE